MLIVIEYHTLDACRKELVLHYSHFCSFHFAHTYLETGWFKLISPPESESVASGESCSVARDSMSWDRVKCVNSASFWTFFLHHIHVRDLFIRGLHCLHQAGSQTDTPLTRTPLTRTPLTRTPLTRTPLTRTPLTRQSRSGLTKLLSRHSVGTYRESSSHATCQGTFVHSHLSWQSHCGWLGV